MRREGRTVNNDDNNNNNNNKNRIKIKFIMF